MAPERADAAWAHRAAFDIWVRLLSRDFRGWDPYDALNTRLLPGFVTRPRLAGRLLTQTMKRCPVPLQPLLAIKRETDAYTLGHALLAGTRLQGAASTTRPGGETPPDLAAACRQIVERLRSMAVRDGDSVAWGYHFPVRTRFFSYSPPTPNLIVTAFVAKGLAAATRAGVADCRAEVCGAVEFILHGLPRVSDTTGDCIGYVPGETTAVHNANLLAALVLCEAADMSGGPHEAFARSNWLDQARRCARFTAARQSPDGSWPYSEEPYGRWVDGFHTGFVLEGLEAVVRATGDQDLKTALLRGLRFYVAQLFGPHGQPKYYPAHGFPFDALSAAQGVETLQVALRATALGVGAAQAVPGQLEWVQDHLLRPGGKVAYQVHRGWTDRREFPRWASAPLMSALAGVPSEELCKLPTESRTEFRTEFCRQSAHGFSRAMTTTQEGPTPPAPPAHSAHSAPPRIAARPRSGGPIWIDLANSPHVLFFQPVIAELHRRGVPTVVSARDFAQTVDLCRLLGLEAEVVGGHGGSGLVGKAGNLAGRVRALCAFARAKAPSVAVSHNSYAQAVAGRLLGLPVVTAMDYEFQPANHLAFRCATLVAVPDVFPLDALRRQGAKPSKVWRYPGLKEEIALAGFVPSPGYLEEAGVVPSPSGQGAAGATARSAAGAPAGPGAGATTGVAAGPAAGATAVPGAAPPVVVVRPPADMALYHRFENPLFGELLARLQELRRAGRARVIVLARTATQAGALQSGGFGDLLWKGAALDGRQVIAAADAVVSAGGSMNREAAVLGTPAFSIFAGRLAAVDRALVAEGRLKLLRSAADIAALEFQKRPASHGSENTAGPAADGSLLMQFVDRLLGVADR